VARISKKLIQRIRVPLGFAFAVVFVLFANPSPVSLAAGSAVAFVGIAIRAWSSGHIRKNRDLARSGPYAFTRNPLYFGSFVLGIGFGISSGEWWLILLFAVLFAGIYLPVMSVESEELIAIFGDEYEEYARQVPLFVPWFRYPAQDRQKFELKLYLGYREYRALLGYLAITGVLILRYYLFG
jgi:protein-S-isoprenylcysteine O-methyltransferase Ste14